MASRCVRVVLASAVFVATLAGCTASNAGAPSPHPAVPAAASCTQDTLRTRTPGRLTFATAHQADWPWFVDNRPQNGRGFEAAVAYAVAERLGFAAADVTWTRSSTSEALAAGPKPFDLGIGQFRATPQRGQAVDFSPPYHLVRQAVVAVKSTQIFGATTIAALRTARLGAQTGTTSYHALADVITPTVAPHAYRTLDEAKRALQNKQVDGLVVDLPTALTWTTGGLTGSALIGQLPQIGVPEQYALVMAKGSPLARCVNETAEGLRQEGTLLMLEKQWLGRAAHARELT